MKTKGFIIGAFALVLVLVATGANAYVPALGTYHPSAADFNWVNNIGTLTWKTGEGTINIDVRVSAPDGDDTNFFSGTYGSYYPDPLYAVGGFTAAYDTVTTNTSGTYSTGTQDPTSTTTFDSMYGYFYTITLVAGYTGSLSDFGFDIGPATITEIGYDTNAAYQPADSWAISNNVLAFGFPGLAGDQFVAGETAAVYVASEYWWGWSNAVFEGSTQTSGGAYNGKLPAPNPEAPTVALFMLGIFGLHVWRNKGLRFMANSQ